MNKPYKYLILILLLNAFVNNVQGQAVITLDEILQQVQSKSFAAKTASNQVRQAEEGIRFYQSQLRPQLGLFGTLPNYSKTSSPVVQPDGTLVFQSIRQANSSFSLYASQVISKTGGILFINSDLQRFDDLTSEYSTYNGIPVRIGISQPLMGFNPWKFDSEIQALNISESKKIYNINIEAAMSVATELYFDILIASQNLEIAKTNESVNQNLLKITEERLQLGKVSRDEKLQLEIELNNAKLNVSQAANAVSRAKASMYTYIGQNYESEIKYIEPSLLQVNVVDVESLLRSYQKNRPEIIGYQKSLLEADKNIAQARNQYGIQANINASIGLARGSETPSEIYSDPFDEQQFNVTLQVPIVDWGRRDAAIAQEKLKKENIKLQYEQDIIELENNIIQVANTFTRLQKDLALLKQIMNNADERFSISNERYVLGNIDITNLTLAQRDKDQAKRNYINALKSYWTNYQQLRLLTGYDITTQSDINY